MEQSAVELDPRQHSAALQTNAAAAQSARGSDGGPGARHWASHLIQPPYNILIPCVHPQERQ